MISPYFAKYGSVSTASGVLNGFAYVGSAISTYGVALLSEKFGRSFTLLSWLAIALLGTAICFFASKAGALLRFKLPFSVPTACR